MAIDYTGFAHPKTKTGKSAKDERKTQNGRDEKAASADKRTVIDRQDGICFGWGVNPHCTKRIWDAHELIPQSQGGPRESWNRVCLCRNCHREGQKRVGGNRLLFHWRGKRNGTPPNADKPNSVWCSWRDQKGVNDGSHNTRKDVSRIPGCERDLLH